MKASMKLKRHLPCAPFPPTKPIRENRIVMTEYGNLIRLDGSSPINRMPSSIGYSVTEQTARNSHEAAKAEKRRRWAIVEKMACEGYSNEEIMKATGYKTAGTVKSIVHQLREAGADIPPRKGGRPKCREQQV